jgi:hypothetical protein
MKAKFTIFLLALGLFNSCTKDSEDLSRAEYVIEDLGNGQKSISGVINENITLESETTWILKGGVFVKDGAVLTIEKGTSLFSGEDDATTEFLSVLRGGKIIAEGTASEPIVFSSAKASPSPGDWGGIIINGYGILNVGDTAEGEGGTGVYGGNDNTDNSGILKYVRVEYAGKILGTDNELNGFSFNGVGSGTTLEYLQAYKGSDDGFEFFGGAANLKYAVSTGNEDDSFDWTHGWEGKGQFWVVEQMGKGDRGIEADNNGDDNTLMPFSNPTLSNLTLIGINDDGENTGMRLREGTKGKIYNAIVTKFPKSGIRVSDQTSLDNMNDGSLVVSNSRVFDNGTNFKDCSPFESVNSTEVISLNGYVGTVDTGAKDPSTIDSWFEKAVYIGAVKSGDDWTSGWTK